MDLNIVESEYVKESMYSVMIYMGCILRVERCEGCELGVC